MLSLNYTMRPRDVKILVVDDEEDFREIFSLFLEKMGYRVRTAADGIEALALFQDFDFDIAIIDYFMPRMDGMELLRELRRRQSNAEVLFISGYGTIPSAVEALKLGVYDYITKPLDLDEVERIIQRIVEVRLGGSERAVPRPVA